MTEPTGRVVKVPTQDELQEAVDLYTAAVGRVAFSWNYLQEEMARLFARIVDATNYEVALAIWHSSFNDRAQRQMLEAAVEASRDPLWGALPPDAKADLKWLMKTANHLGEKRDEAIHAPCALFIDAEGSAMAANIMSGHRRAKSLTGKQLLIEFDWLERYTDALSRFTYGVWLAMVSDNAPWPEKPSSPDRRPRKALQGRLRRLPPEPPAPPPQSSPA